jgi:hypothetical protein
VCCFDVPEYRRHTSRLSLLKSLALILVLASVALYNLVWTVIGLSTGSVRHLGRGPYYLVRWETDSWWFMVNICVRATFFLLFGTIAVALWRQLRRDMRT